ncbi:hypothetical protein PFICI_11259 [Pestalotiopsis fici W106-1]|uniref:Stc1 domain-containing protein n=1 Tax=Pestalotiopsis fici (strain W106-1 / CGMCC3.15140) TaxID=1229662 RepID=W3WU57_PESFW|nr:uncharacterized protein PFICI_11259 [Pestalotiopsis fici W106-1]ETS77385.1 hypothetical protein PFICI_11259 [Pestalotiopsis fici W106-1]
MPSLVGNTSALADRSNQNGALPQTFKCSIGGEWKPNSSFSNKQLAKWRSAKRSHNDRVTPASIGLICREHSGEPATGLKCNGPCGLWKARDQFSGNQRRNNLPWCIACTQWQVEQDYDTVPLAAPNEINEAADEHQGFSNAVAGIEIDEDDDDDDDDDQAVFASARSVRTAGTTLGDDDEDDDDDRHFGTDDEDDNYNVPRGTSVTVSNVTAAQTRPKAPAMATNVKKAATTATSASRIGSSIPARSQASNAGPSSLMGSSAQSGPQSPEAWVPPHLLEKENMMTLRENNIVERHVPNYSQQASTASLTSYSGQPQPRIAPPRRHAFPTQSGASISTRASERSYTTTTGTDYRRRPENIAQGPPGSRRGEGTPSIVSSDSRAGPAMTPNTTQRALTGNRQATSNQSFQAYDDQGNAHRRIANPGNSGPSAPSAQPARGPVDRVRPQRGNFARVDQRRDFEIRQRPQTGAGAYHIVVYDSGSDDSF